MPGSKFPTIVAIDLGAESCRVSLLQWDGETPRVELVHRFANGPVSRGSSLYWDFDGIFAGLEEGLRLCGEKASAQVASIGVDGWAVDYVRLDASGVPIGAPYCYRDARTESVFEEWHRRHSNAEMFQLSGVQPLRFNTVYQLMADRAAGVAAGFSWVNLPEYVMAKLGARRVSEYTNATHTGLVDPKQRIWRKEIFDLCGLEMAAAPELVATGTDVGRLQGALGDVAALHGARLIATACHDTASAVAAIPLDGSDWAYISSGTWSLVGTLLDVSINTAEAQAAGFTNLGAAGSRVCFHKNVNGMWLLRQTLEQLCPGGEGWTIPELTAACAGLPTPENLLDVDDDSFLLPEGMATRINAQLVARGFAAIEETAAAMPQFACLIFHSLAARYAEVLRNVEQFTGKKLKKLAMVGGGSLNQFLNQLTAQATGLEIVCGAAESSTIGNFAIQLATLEGKPNDSERISHWARVLTSMHAC